MKSFVTNSLLLSTATALQSVSQEAGDTARAELIIAESNVQTSSLTIITTVAGSGIPGNSDAVSSAEPLKHRFSNPSGGSFDTKTGHYYVTDTGGDTVKRLNVDNAGQVISIDTVVRNVTTFISPITKQPTSIALRNPGQILVDSDQAVYFSDESNHRVIRYTPSTTDCSLYLSENDCGQWPTCTWDKIHFTCFDGVLDVIAGDSTCHGGITNPCRRGMKGDCGAATLAELAYPRGLAKYSNTDSDYLFIADSGNHRVRKVELTSFPRCIAQCGRLVCGLATPSATEFDASSVDECAYECDFKADGNLCAGWQYNNQDHTCKHFQLDNTPSENFVCSWIMDNSITSATSTCGTRRSDWKLCRPGKIETLISGSNAENDECNDSECEMLNSWVSLNTPHGIAVQSAEHAAGGVPTLLTMDTNNHRMLSTPLQRFTRYKVSFWVVLEGAAALSLGKDECQYSKTGPFVGPSLVCCHYIRISQSDGIQDDEAAARSHLHAQICSDAICILEDEQACLGMCEDCFSKCGIEHLKLSSSTSTRDRCEAFEGYSKCIEDTSSCSSNAQMKQHFLQGINQDVNNNIKLVCQEEISDDGSCPCCDSNIARILGVQNTNDVERPQSVSLYYDISLSSYHKSQQLGNMLSEYAQAMKEVKNKDCVLESRHASCVQATLLVNRIRTQMRESGIQLPIDDLAITIVSNFGKDRSTSRDFTFAIKSNPSYTHVQNFNEQSLHNPRGAIIDKSGRVVFADTGISKVRMLTLDGKLQDIAGNGEFYYFGDDSIAIDASINMVSVPSISNEGALFLPDSNNHRIRAIYGFIDGAAPCPTYNSDVQNFLSRDNNDMKRRMSDNRNQKAAVMNAMRTVIKECNNCYGSNDDSNVIVGCASTAAQTLCHPNMPAGGPLAVAGQALLQNFDLAECKSKNCAAGYDGSIEWSICCEIVTPELFQTFFEEVDRLDQYYDSDDYWICPAVNASVLTNIDAGGYSHVDVGVVLAEATSKKTSADKASSLFTISGNSICQNNWGSSCMRDLGLWTAHYDTCSEIGPSYYNMKSRIPIELIHADSSCRPRCDIGFMSYMRSINKAPAHCCKWGQCELFEGHCASDDECAGNLICGRNNCPWSKDDNCCKQPSFNDYIFQYQQLNAKNT